MIKYYIIQKKFLLENPFVMFLANFIFVVSHLKIHSPVHSNTSKALLAFIGCRAPGCRNRAEKNSNTITSVSIIIMLLWLLLWHIENPGIVRTVYSGIFRYIQRDSAILNHVQAYGGVFRHVEAYSAIIVGYGAIIRHAQNCA